MASAFARLPNTQSSSTSTRPAFFPDTVSVSAATTFRLLRCVTSVMVRTLACMWNIADSSSSARTMAAAGLKLLSATSFVGARISNSSSSRQHKIKAVSMMPAAMVDLVFFLLISRPNSRMSCLPVSAWYAPKMQRTKSNTHSSQTSSMVGLPGRSGTRSALKMCKAASASLA